MRQGFSLVELSIVLVILGLLTGGILAGQSLIRAAELRSVAADVQRYRAAFHSFRDKYFAVPGDMRTAVRFWGAQAGGMADGVDSTCQALGFSSPATTQATCNGDGDGQIGWPEAWRAWQHLANAGLVEGSYAGVTGSSSSSAYGTSGFNMPKSKMGLAGYVAIYEGIIASSPRRFDGDYGTSMRFGRGEGVDEFSPLIAEEVWNIDMKLDDGKPAYGSFRVEKNSSRPNCASTDVANTAEYLLQNKGGSCNFHVLKIL